MADLRAANVRLEIAKRECGSDPLSIVRFAKGQMKKDRGIDECYCIVDRDSHENFSQAVQEASDFQASLGKKRVFCTTKSYPCFEYWFILHYEDTTAPYSHEGDRSPGENALKRLKKHVPAYDKADRSVISSFMPLTDVASRNAERSFTHAENSCEFNPSTEVHLLVRRLQSFK